jgi:hypothetical protein
MAANKSLPKPLTKRGRFWAQHLRQWQQSGLTQVEYCRQKHLSAPALGWWKRQLPLQVWSVVQSADREAPRGAFVELPVRQDQDATYEISLSRGRRLRLGPQFDLDRVRQLVELLEPSC